MVFTAAFYAQAPRIHAADSPISPPPASAFQTAARVTASADPAALVKQYCVTCHNERLKTAGLVLDQLDVTRVGVHADVWEKVVQKVRSGAMPPAGSRRPDQPTFEAFTTWLENELDREAAAHPNPGRPADHRLNQFEYGNAIRDLLALDINAQSLLPADESDHGFDNIAEVLSVSPTLLERYLVAAHKISRLAVGDPTAGATVEMFDIPRSFRQDERMSDDLPVGTRGGLLVRHYFPLDGEYVLRVRLQRNFTNSTIRAIETREKIDVLLDGTQITRFTIGGECVGSKDPKCQRSGTVQPTGAYERTADDGLEVRFAAKAGMHSLGVAFVKKSMMTEGPAPTVLPPRHTSSTYEAPRMDVDYVRLEGPFNVTGPGDTASRRRIFVCRPARTEDDEPCAKKILSALAWRAYRRPVTDRDVETLMQFYRTGQGEGGFERGIQDGLARILVSPQFLFRTERDPAAIDPGGSYRISDLELASRLSFFLWSSIPDEQLLDLAERGTFRDPKTLEEQVRRMLTDPRATALVKNFCGQWLYLRNMKVVDPDPRLFPGFDDNLREDFTRETELFLESQLRQDRPLEELLTADYTFVNERLARFYGIRNVYGNHFRRVAVTDPHRGGLLGHASILTVTSYATRTSPVLRGKYLLDNILGAPPPPPPPNVPPLAEVNPGVPQPASMRERMEQHRRNPVCATCHARMDPLGFALENFDAVGKYRTVDGHSTIDASGILPDGTRFSNPTAFRQALLTHRNEFVRTFTERLTTYALGRAVQYYDMPAVRTIVRDAAATNYRWSSLISAIVRSRPFQMRRALEAATNQP
jgi:mono/diheme cytochrome c family protein